MRIYNTKTLKVEEFVPLKEKEVSMYVCGPTVYNHVHIGNVRPVVVFDTLRRLFEALGYTVRYVSNYTDVDDKIINRAKELGIDEKTLTESVIQEYRSLVEAVGSMQPDETPKPTIYMPQILSYVKELVENGSAYAVDGDVYLKVQDIPAYGELSGNSVEQLESGARIDINDKKADPLDFALWKKTNEGIKWQSPWGEGRPGWHTECCVMINSIFADQGGYIDIHGGGFDLKFPHHENEIAQAKAHNHHKLAHFWMHNGFINVDNEKMSKSLGNVILMKDVVNEFGGIPFRMMILAAHYRAPASFSEETIREAQKKYAQLC
ncbi:MAG: cysteine--tRNA ligase, partial [Erysipelotrichaceae bacterium]|nr:cysteine--tRNA ligase [Erysipelotrichaceae bacterium]